jgi:hypothetical protein
MIPAFLRAAALSALLLSTLPLDAAEAVPSVESFFQKPLMTGAAISPNGRQVALRLLSKSGRKTLAIYDTASGGQRLIGNFGEGDVNSFYWLSDKRLAFTLANIDGHMELGDPGLYAMDADGRNVEFLSTISFPKPSFADPDLRSAGALMSTAGHGFPYRKSEAVMALAADERRTWLVRVDTRTGTKTPVRMPRFPITG